MLVQDIAEIKDGKIITKDGRTVDQIYKGFQIYKSGKAPAEFTAIKENDQYRGSEFDVKRQIDKYWEKKDAEEVLKKKTGDDKVPLEEVSKTVSELYNEYGAVLTPDKVIIKFIRKYGLTSSDIDRLMPSIKLALRMLPKVKDEVLKKKTEDDESIRGKDGYILRVYISGSGYNWEAYDPEGQKTKTGLSAGSVQHAKESADQKLGMKIFVDSKPTTDALDPDETHDIRDIEKETINNNYFRKVLFTTARMQLVVMCIKPGEDIGEEVHPTTDQFFRIEEGEGKAIVDGREINIKDGSSILIKSGRVHNIINDSNKPLKLYSLYSPPHHRDGLIQEKKDSVEA